MGGGWGGVLKWCHAASQRYAGPLSHDPTLSSFGLIILHLDADVAAKSYTDCGPEVPEMAQTADWCPLPCKQPCPPAADTCAALEQVLLSWLGRATVDHKVIRCIPAQSSGAWLATALLDAAHPLLQSAECNLELENRLSTLPKQQRVKKTVADYRRVAPAVQARWEEVKSVCGQAMAFEATLHTALGQSAHSGHRNRSREKAR